MINSLVHVILDRKKIVGHSLKRELMKQRRNAVEAAIQNQQLGPGLLRPFTHGRLVGFVSVQFLLYDLSQFDVSFVIAANK